jgi:hypothetical protein
MFMKLTAGAKPRREPLKGASIRSALLENIRLGWKSLTRTKDIVDKGKSLLTLTKIVNVIKPFFPSSPLLPQIKPIACIIKLITAAIYGYP